MAFSSRGISLRFLPSSVYPQVKSKTRGIIGNKQIAKLYSSAPPPPASAMTLQKPNSLQLQYGSNKMESMGSNFDFIVQSEITQVEIPNIGLDEYVWADVSKWSSKIAMECALTGRNYTYGQCRVMTNRFASALIKLGLKPGDIIALVLPNVPEFPIAFLGANAAGVACTLINPQYTPDEMTKQMMDCGVKAVVTMSLFTPIIQSAASKVKSLKSIIVIGDAEDGCHTFKEMVRDNGSAFPPPNDRPENRHHNLTCLPYSSGTTGKPKGVMLTHRNLMANIRSCIQPNWCNFRETTEDNQEVFIAVLPFFHILSLNAILMGGLSLGAKIVCLPNFEPTTFVKALAQYKPTFLHTVPRLMDYIASNQDIKLEYLEKVHAVVCGGSPAGKKIILKLMDRLHPQVINYQEGYGMTETSPVICIHKTKYSLDKLGSCGTLVPMTEVMIVDTETKEALGPNSVGEIYCRGPQVMKGYWNNEEATRDSFDGKWLKTGDVAYYDDDLHFHIVDRIKELIKVKGFQVAPSEIEELLLEVPGVLDAAVIGVPDGGSGELPRAYIVKDDKSEAILKLNDIHDYLKTRLAPYKQLSGGIQFISSVPRNPSGKILRRELRAQLMNP